MKKKSNITRKDFIKSTAIITAGVGITGGSVLASPTRPVKNTLPKWKGFNLLDFFNPDPANPRPPTEEVYFKWMADWGFDFVRIPMAYPYYIDFDRSRNITPEEVYQIDDRAVDRIDQLVATAHKYNMHVSLNLHRAPGYCVNAGFHEPYNLWLDEEAQKAFNFHWEMWAKRYRNYFI